MKEIISFFVGQAGVQLSSALWELFAAEHKISVCGQMSDDESFKGTDRLFNMNSENQCVPRCLLVDFDATVIDEIRHGCYRDFFGADNLMSGTEDSASIFSRGYFTQGRLYLNEIIHRFNRQVETADSMQGFVFVHALGGGTGSGLCSLVLEELDGYSKISKMDLSVHPSFPNSPIVVEPYNSVLAEHYTIDETDISFMVDNEALFRMASKNLENSHPSYASINRIVAQAFSSITSSSRYGELSSTLSEVLHNLVPYPRIHFPTISISPVSSCDSLRHSHNTTFSITQEALSNKSQLLNCFPDEGKYMTCCLMYRGNVNSGEIYECIRKLKCHENLRFVDWCPTGIKVTLCNIGPTFIGKSDMGYSDKMLTIVSNNSSITDPMLHNTFRFQVLFQKRAFVHWYVGEGMEEDEFKESLENIACLIKDYDECSLPTKILEDNVDNQSEKTEKKNLSNVNSKDSKSSIRHEIDEENLNENHAIDENENNVSEDWVSSFQISGNNDDCHVSRKVSSKNNVCSENVEHKDNFSVSVTIPINNKSF